MITIQKKITKKGYKKLQELIRLNSIEEDIISFYYNNKERFEHNKKEIEKIDNSEIDRKFLNHLNHENKQ